MKARPALAVLFCLGLQAQTARAAGAPLQRFNVEQSLTEIEARLSSLEARVAVIASRLYQVEARLTKLEEKLQSLGDQQTGKFAEIETKLALIQWFGSALGILILGSLWAQFKDRNKIQQFVPQTADIQVAVYAKLLHESVCERSCRRR